MTIKEKILSTFEGKKDKIFKPNEITDLILQKFPDTNKSSIKLADHCYNRINKDTENHFDFHVFESLGDGTYRFLGEKYPFDGPILWKGKIVGEWKNGQKPERIDLEST